MSEKAYSSINTSLKPVVILNLLFCHLAFLGVILNLLQDLDSETSSE